MRGQGSLLILLAGSVALGACSVDSAKSRYVLAEKLWADGKHAAAVSEFDKVVAKEPRGKLGTQALYRAALTQSLYLNEYAEAVRKFRAFVDASGDPLATWEAQKQIGDILFTKTEQYDQAITHYRELLRQKPGAEEAPEFLYRIAKSHFFLWQFDDAVFIFQEIQKRFPRNIWAERAAFEIGVTYFTRGEQQPGTQGPGIDSYQLAIKTFEKFLKNYPQSQWAAEARFHIASCHEELDQLDTAFTQYEALQSSYPSPNVIKIKLARIRERKLQRSR